MFVIARATSSLSLELDLGPRSETMSKSPVNDMFSATPAALAKMRSARADLALDTSPFLQTPPALRASPGQDATSLAPVFAEMMSASPANLAKMRASSDVSAATQSPHQRSTAMGSPVSPVPQAAFAEMFSGSPADLAAMRATRSETTSNGYGNSNGYAPSSPLVQPADPNRFDAMFAASPAHLNKMRAEQGSPYASPFARSGDHDASPIAADPHRFDDMFSASPANLSKMRAASSNVPGVSYGQSFGAAKATTSMSHQPMDANSGRFTVVYDVVADNEKDARAKILAICLEQTVELPEALVPEGMWIREHVVGRLEKLTPGAGLNGSWRCEISYHTDTTGGEITQLINVVFGNTSMKEGVMVADLKMPDCVLSEYPGPKFGVEGLRKLVNVPFGPMIMTALKPMGSSVADLAKMAYQFAKGGIDIIKDDHGLADQPWAPYDQRVRACTAAVARANAETGRRCIYAPCINAPAHLVMQRAHFARDAGAGAVLMIPGITGLDTMRELAADETFGLPIICHPALLGAMLGGGSKQRVGGFSHEVLLGVLPRLAGADATIFPSFGGRFGFTMEECLSLQNGASRPMGTFPPIFPSPGGGMTLERVASMNQAYGEDLMLLIGGSLMGHSPDLVANAKHFMKIAGRTDLWGPKENVDGARGSSGML